MTVVIGVDAPLTGGMSSMGLGIRNSADLAVKTANKKRLVPGVKFEIKSLDDASDPTKGQENAAGFTAEFKKLGGTVVGAEQVDDGQTDFSDLAASVRASGADAVYFGGYYDTAGPLSKPLKEAGADIPLMDGDGMFTEAFLTSGPKADGDLAVNIGVPAEELAGGADFLARYREAGHTDDAGWYGPYAYDATWSIVEAVKALVKANGGTLPGTPARRCNRPCPGSPSTGSPSASPSTSTATPSIEL